MMKTMRLVKTLLPFLALATITGKAQDERILVPQTGFMPGISNVAVIKLPADSFYIQDASQQICFRGKLSSPSLWPFSGETVQQAVFSQLQAAGRYTLTIPGSPARRTFSITADPFGEIAAAAVKALYYNRCSYPILAEFGGKWARKAGHPDTAVYVHSSAVSASRAEDFRIASPGGWYDAGDYNKYIVNSAITTYTMLLAYEMYPDYWREKNLNIPESGNILPDILDETLFNLRWMLTMQDTDGGVYHKCTTRQFEGFVMPEEAREKRYVIQKNTAASLDFAATMAHAAGVLDEFKGVLPGLADSCRKAAKAAWEWSVKNPGILYQQPADIGTGAYGDQDLRDEWFWAGTEMAILNGTTSSDSLLAKLSFKTPAWGDVGTLGLITSLAKREKVSAERYERCRDIFLTYVDHLVEAENKAAYPVSLDYFAWGSNSDVANQGLLKLVANHVRPDLAYVQSAVLDMQYLTGVNPTGYCFITGFGEKSPMRIHHRPSECDKVEDPVPGLLVGGPNTVVMTDCPDNQRSSFPALSYIDELCSYSTNEIAINWNAPLVFLSGGLSHLAATMNND